MDSDEQSPSPSNEEQQCSFNVHAGRMAFRRMSAKAREMVKDLEAMDVEELRRQHFAMRSFTESVEEEDSPRQRSPRGAPPHSSVWPAEGDEEEDHTERANRHGECGTMHESSTADTIVEVLRVDPAKGETQKYVMRVPGPELVDQEFELHKSLMANAAEALDAEVEMLSCAFGAETACAMNGGDAERTAAPTADWRQSRSTTRPDPMRPQARSCSVSSTHSGASPPPQFAARPRPTTPTGLCHSRMESLISEAAQKAPVAQRMPPDSFLPQMRVVIPARREKLKDGQRRYSTGQRDLLDRHTSKREAQQRIRCGSTAAWSGDIIESNPEYAQNAPPKPVIHRRSSTDWESFDEADREETRPSNGKENDEPSNEQLDNGDFVKALEEVRHLIEEAEHKLHFEDLEPTTQTTLTAPVATKQMTSFTPTPSFACESPPTPTSTPNAILAHPQVGQSRAETAFETPEQFTSAPYTSATAPTPALAAPPPPKLVAQRISQEVVETVVHQRAEDSPAAPFDHDLSAEYCGQASEEAPLEHYSSAVEQRMTATLEYPADSANPFTVAEPQYCEYGTTSAYYGGAGTTEYGGASAYHATESHASTGYGVGAQQSYNSAAEQQSYYGSTGTQGYTSDQQQGYGYTEQQGYGGAEQQAYGSSGYGGAEYQGYGGYAQGYDATHGYGGSSGYGGTVGYGDSTQQQGYGGYDQYGQTAQADYATASNPFATQDYSAYGATTSTEAYGAYGSATDQQQHTYGGAEAASYGQPAETSAYGVPADTSAYGVPADTSAYGVPADTSAYGVPADASQYDAPVDVSAYGVPADTTAYGHPVDTSAYGQPVSAQPPQFLQPLLPAQRARTPDPYSWEAQESAYEEHGQALPPRPPPPPRTPEKTPLVLTPTEPSAEHQQQQSAFQVEEETQKAPPPRPKAPPPARPPAQPAPSRPLAPPTPRAVRKEEGAAAAKVEEPEEEDAWARFAKMTERVGAAMKSTEQRLGQLGKESAAHQVEDDRLVQGYLEQTGGPAMQLSAAQRAQLQEQEAERKRLKAEKKRKKIEKLGGQLGAAISEKIGAVKRAPSPPVDPTKELDLEKAATELAKKIAAQHGFELNNAGAESSEEEQEADKTQQEAKTESVVDDEKAAVADAPIDPAPQFVADFSRMEASPAAKWGAFEQAALMPPSESDLCLAEKLRGAPGTYGTAAAAPDVDPFAPVPKEADPAFDPFDVRPVDELIAEARQLAELEHATAHAEGELLAPEAKGADRLSVSRHSSPTPEGGSPVSTRPIGFDDDFKGKRGTGDGEETPLFDEDDSAPLPEFPVPFRGDGWELLLRYPPKKKLMADRYWKPIYVRLQGPMLAMFTSKEETRPSQEILIQANYSLSDVTLQPYDVYGKIHTVKLQHVLYKERVGIRPGQISRLVEGHITKYGLPLEHAAQCTVLAKFASLSADVLATFTHAVEDLLFRCSAKRETTPIYRQDEVQMHCYDEYEARVDKEGNVSDQKARVRLFCLSFLSGSPFLEIGLNDRRREGKEVVRRKDILPMHTERWIRFEAPEFHESVEPTTWAEDQVVRIPPPDGCFFEVMRFRVRPPRNRDKPLTVKCQMRMAGSKVEIRIDAMAAAHQQRARGTLESTRTIPCEDIAIRFPIPEAWIYIFREQRHWGVGSVHSKTRKPGKAKNLRDKLMGTVQNTEQSLIEVGIGEAKYEHLFRSLVWRIPRLPERESAAYKSYMLKCRFELSSFDLMPEQFLPDSDVEFTMPLAVISNTVVRSVGVEQHEDSERVEKFVRYVAKCKYTYAIDYVHCADLDIELPTSILEEEDQQEKEPQKHVAAFDPGDVQTRHEGYRIELPDDDRLGRAGDTKEANGGRRGSSSSSSDGEEERRGFPVVQINMKGYGY